MSDDQEMVDVEVVDVETEEEMSIEGHVHIPYLKEEENIQNIENIVVINADNIKEEENALTIVEENVGIEGGGNITVKEEEEEEKQDVVNGTSIENNEEGKDGDAETPADDCGVPTFVHVHRNDFVDKPSDESENVVKPVCIEPLNKDDHVEDVEDVEMEVSVEVAAEGEKRKRKRVPRKIPKVEINENGEPVDNKPYKCEQCHWQFKQRYRFKRHMRTHTGERPYKCLQCQKQFSRSHILKVHMMIHTGEKPFRCEECGWSFMKKYHLQRHMRTHTGEMPFVCQECGVHFSRQYYLKKHLVSAHGATLVVKTEKKLPKSAAAESIVIENSDKNCIEVVCTIELDESKGQVCIPEKLEVVGESNQNGCKTSSKDENGVADVGKDENGSAKEPEQQNGSTVHSPNCSTTNSENQDGTAVDSENQNGTAVDSENQNGSTINSTNQNCSTLNSAYQNRSTINSAYQKCGDASLKECIEMVNQLVEKKSMEPLKRDMVGNVSLNMNNETESHIDVDFHTIPVK